MADIADEADKRNEEHLKESLKRAKHTHLRGESECRKCGEWNDRAEAGYAVCSECVAAPSTER